MTVAVDLLVITDGRRCVVDAIKSAEENLVGAELTRWLYDDSGDPGHREWLGAMFPRYRIFWHAQGRRGFGGAIRCAWRRLRADATAPWIFHLEDDFTFNRPVELDRLAGVLEHRPHLAQIALLRQPWNEAERAAGGLVAMAPGEFVEWTNGDGDDWLEHSRWGFTTNPTLYRRSLIDSRDWPRGEQSEGRFGLELIGAGYCSAYWGALDSGEWVHHIGDMRTGTGY